MQYFFLSYSYAEERVILDCCNHGEPLTTIPAESWKEAREQVDMHPALDGFRYREGRGWVIR